MKKMFLVFALVLLVSLPLTGQTVQVGDQAPEFSGITIRGNEFSLYNTVEDSIVVIYFMGYS